MPPRICILGSINMDLVIQAPRFPQPGETLIGGRFQTFPGGKGENQAVAAARMGPAVTMIGCVGSDPYGQTLRGMLAGEGVGTTHILTREGASTGVALITVAAQGENTIIVSPGANALLTPDDIDQHREPIDASDLLVMQLETPLAAVRRAAELARRAGRRVLLNAAPANPLAIELLTLVDVLVVNHAEAALLCGADAHASPVDMARHLHAGGAHQVVITLGARGAIAFEGTTVQEQSPFNVTAVDSTAAGDAFVGALATRLAEGRSIQESMRWGAAAGALAATKLGAIPSLPRRGDVESMLHTK